MNAIEQFIYTSSPWGKSGSGWMVFQKSDGISDELVKQLYPCIRYSVPNGFEPNVSDKESLSRFPVQFVSFKLGENWILAQTCYTGITWWEKRSGDFWAHVYVIPYELWKSNDGIENPMRFYKSSLFLREYPQELKDEFRRIASREIAYYPPPKLDSYDNLDMLQTIGVVDTDALFEGFNQSALKKLVVLLSCVIDRLSESSNTPALVFDATNPASVATMAWLLELLPQSLRREACLATYIHTEKINELKANDIFLCYGTVKDKAKADADVGIYDYDTLQGSNNLQRLKFKDVNDVKLFKQLVDAAGDKLTLVDYAKLVDCWMVASGQPIDLDTLRSAMATADQYGLRKNMEDGLSGESAVDNTSGRFADLELVSVVAWFEYNISAFQSKAIEECSKCVKDFTLITQLLTTLKANNEASLLFLKTVSEKAEKNAQSTAFANLILQNGSSLEQFRESLDEKSLLRLILEFRRIKNDHRIKIDLDKITKNASSEDVKNALEYVENALKTVDELLEKTVLGVDGLSVEKKRLENSEKLLKYRLDIIDLKIDNVKNTWEKYLGTGEAKVEGVDFREDVLEHFSSLAPKEFVKLGKILEGLGLRGYDAICEKWEQDRRELIEESNKRLMERQNAPVKTWSPDGISVQESSEKKPQKGEGCFRRGCLIVLIACAISIVLYFLVGFLVENATCEMPQYLRGKTEQGHEELVKGNENATPG